MGRSRDMGGSGLGLSIVRHIIEKPGQTIAVRSKEEKEVYLVLHWNQLRTANISFMFTLAAEPWNRIELHHHTVPVAK